MSLSVKRSFRFEMKVTVIAGLLSMFALDAKAETNTTEGIEYACTAVVFETNKGEKSSENEYHDAVLTDYGDSFKYNIKELGGSYSGKMKFYKVKGKDSWIARKDKIVSETIYAKFESKNGYSYVYEQYDKDLTKTRERVQGKGIAIDFDYCAKI